jgi:hypothetical protein
MTTRLWRGVFLIALLVPAMYPSEAAAGRVLGFTVRLDGKDHLFGSAGDNGEAPPGVVWRRLSSTELAPVDGAEVKPDADDPLRATLRGNIAIDVTYGGKATVKELRLVRQTPTAVGWTVDSRDVEQIAKDIGLPEAGPSAAAGTEQPTPAATASQQSPWVWVGAGLAMALFASGFLVTWMRRRMPPPMPLAGPAEPPFADAE